jgi:hypothetical protein
MWDMIYGKGPINDMGQAFSLYLLSSMHLRGRADAHICPSIQTQSGTNFASGNVVVRTIPPSRKLSFRFTVGMWAHLGHAESTYVVLRWRWL